MSAEELDRTKVHKIEDLPPGCSASYWATDDFGGLIDSRTAIALGGARWAYECTTPHGSFKGRSRSVGRLTENVRTICVAAVASDR